MPKLPNRPNNPLEGFELGPEPEEVPVVAPVETVIEPVGMQEQRATQAAAAKAAEDIPAGAESDDIEFDTSPPPGSSPKTKTCVLCRRQKPLISPVFTRDPESPDGFDDLCAACINEAHQEAKQAASIGIAAAVDESISGSLALAIRDIVPGESEDYNPHISTTFEEIMRSLGGNRRFAQMFVANLLATPLGSKERRGMLGDVMKLGVKVTEEGRAKTLDQVSTEDLREQATVLLKELRNRSAAQQVVAQVTAPGGSSVQPPLIVQANHRESILADI